MARSRETSSRRNPAEAIAAAANEIIAESDAFTVKQVSERAGVALQTFYRHFGSKDELILAMLEESVIASVRELVALAEEAEDPVERLKRLLQFSFYETCAEADLRMFNWCSRERQRLAQRFPREIQASLEPFRTAVATTLHRLKAAGLIESQDPALDAVLIQQQVVSTFSMAQSRGTEYSAEELADRIWELTWRGLRVVPNQVADTAHRRSPEGGVVPMMVVDVQPEGSPEDSLAF
jgi:TetR/AcrR family transcriptional regulator